MVHFQSCPFHFGNSEALCALCSQNHSLDYNSSGFVPRPGIIIYRKSSHDMECLACAVHPAWLNKWPWFADWVSLNVLRSTPEMYLYKPIFECMVCSGHLFGSYECVYTDPGLCGCRLCCMLAVLMKHYLSIFQQTVPLVPPAETPFSAICLYRCMYSTCKPPMHCCYCCWGHPLKLCQDKVTN